jgi:hypothetical protein
MPNFEYFLSCGIPEKHEGERYKKTPEMVKEAMAQMPQFKVPARFIVFKRWDMLKESDNPEVAIFFAQPDVLSGLFTLTNFDETEPNGVLLPSVLAALPLYSTHTLKKLLNAQALFWECLTFRPGHSFPIIHSLFRYQLTNSHA